MPQEPSPPNPVSQELPVTVKLRPVDQEDIHFVLSSWVMSYMGANRSIDHDDFTTGQQALIGALAARSNLVVACDADMPGFILGWACGDLRTNPSEPAYLRLHYVYVKHDYRHHRLAEHMVRHLGWKPGLEIQATHRNHVLTDLRTKHAFFKYNPYPLMLGFKE